LSKIAIQRLYSQQLAQTSFKLPGEMVAWLGAVQGQDYPGAKWSFGLRLPGSTDAIIEQAIADKTIIRSWVMRGTLHFVAAADIHWLLALVAQRLISGSAHRYKELELDEPTLVHSNNVLAGALQSGKQLTRTELFAILEQNGISTKGQRGVHILQRASLDGLICQGVTQRNNPTFFSFDELPPQTKMFVREEALAELAQRYFISRGPATLQDFIWWSGLSSADARVGLDAIESQLLWETIDGQTYWRSSSAPSKQENLKIAYLLPGFDEYLLAYKDRSASLDVPRYKRTTPTNGMLPATIVIDGRVVGTWKRVLDLKKDRVFIEANPFAAFNEEENNVFALAAGRYGEYLGLSAELRAR
jgi:hypothetical protein